MTLFILPLWFCSAPTPFCSVCQEFVTGRGKLCFPNLHKRDTFSSIFFLHQVVLIEKEEEEGRGARQNYAHVSWAGLNSLPQLKPDHELDQTTCFRYFCCRFFCPCKRKKKNTLWRPEHRDMLSQAAAERSSRACQSVKAVSPCFPLRGGICFLAARSHVFERQPVRAAFISFVSCYCWL